ncbi:MAG: EVE domain-containing protein [Cellvibrio sp.]|uniref:EVE domain-containing protein n=1 Tax=Cellvibrio sp. TaxID=1965322 RepID=UPI00271B6A98|nr:EVE domain-containing protein [Cellvibrio sp.]
MAKNYWLFKAEPHIYGIDQLAAAPNKTGRWDGIRNYQARNFLRDQVALNDEVFIYHSSCKNVGIVGTAKVVKTAYPDPTQFNPESDYYDLKSTPENPRWVSVDIKLTNVFSRLISLAEIKAHPQLENMVLVKQSRLSTQPVTADEWKVINTLLM